MDKAIRFSPEIEFTHDEQAQIAQFVASSGFRLLLRIMRSEVDKTVVNLINAPEGDDKTIIARHTLSKASAEFMERVVARINEETGHYVHTVTSSGPPIDPTEGSVDMGAPASTIEDLLAGFELNPDLLEEEL